MKIHRKRFRRKAFTLIEALIVVAILGIIAAVVFPALRNARASSEKRAAEGNAKTLNDARDRAIITGVGGISSMDEWTNTFGTNGQAAAAFLITNGLVRVNSTGKTFTP